MAKVDIGTIHFRDFYGVPYMLERYAYTTKREGMIALRKAEAFSRRYRRNEKHHLFTDKVKSGEHKGKTVYVVGGRGR